MEDLLILMGLILMLAGIIMNKIDNIAKIIKNNNSKITRFEVIDEKGRVYTNNNCKIELSYQDDNRTLKVFIKDGK